MDFEIEISPIYESAKDKTFLGDGSGYYIKIIFGERILMLLLVRKMSVVEKGAFK